MHKGVPRAAPAAKLADVDLDLVCYVFEGWRPLIRASPARRDWMDATPEAYAYRCLPLNIANALGWELLSPCGFEAVWNGGARPEDVKVIADRDAQAADLPVGLFGAGVLTFHVQGLFRTPPGWDLWIGGPPNSFKDGVAPLAASIETDWSPYSFTMNWRFTRPNHRVRFEKGEPFCWFTPSQRGAAEAMRPRIASIEEAPELKRAYEAWSLSRNAFHARVAAHPPARPADKWQKLYFRGVDPEGRVGCPDHRLKLRLQPFEGGSPQPTRTAEPHGLATSPAAPPESGLDDLFGILEQLRSLSLGWPTGFLATRTSRSMHFSTIITPPTGQPSWMGMPATRRLK